MNSFQNNWGQWLCALLCSALTVSCSSFNPTGSSQSRLIPLQLEELPRGLLTDAGTMEHGGSFNSRRIASSQIEASVVCDIISACGWLPGGRCTADNDQITISQVYPNEKGILVDRFGNASFAICPSTAAGRNHCDPECRNFFDGLAVPGGYFISEEYVRNPNPPLWVYDHGVCTEWKSSGPSDIEAGRKYREITYEKWVKGKYLYRGANCDEADLWLALKTLMDHKLTQDQLARFATIFERWFAFLNRPRPPGYFNSRYAYSSSEQEKINGVREFAEFLKKGSELRNIFSEFDSKLEQFVSLMGRKHNPIKVNPVFTTPYREGARNWAAGACLIEFAVRNINPAEWYLGAEIDYIEAFPESEKEKLNLLKWPINVEHVPPR